METADLIVIGGGIVGLATAFHLQEKHPQKRILVLEKEESPAMHQTGRNSGVIHSGIYYKPGSLKALNCRRGKQMLEDFCTKKGIEFETCGKVIVAVDESELKGLDFIYKRGKANGVDCELIDKQRLHELEPHCSGIKAIHVRESGIIDYIQVCLNLADELRNHGNQLLTSQKVTGVREEPGHVLIRTKHDQFSAKHAVNCAGLYSDHIARLSGADPDMRIIPFRGEYYELHPNAHNLCKNLIYPVPDPRFPFLGVHFTRMIDGGVECGPNAVLAFGRESYHKLQVHPGELISSLAYPGFIKMASKFWQMGMGEMWRSFNKSAFVRALQRLIPDVRSRDLSPAPAGIRAQAVASDGKLIDDFAFKEQRHIIHVLNAPSPAATASLSIGETVADKLTQLIEK